MRILALDLGDKWIGSALSDPLGIIAQPYQTVTLKELTTFLTQLINEKKIKTIVIGYPKTLKGTQSEQTKKVVTQKEQLAETFPDIDFVLWDERLSSKRAAQLKKSPSKEDKLRLHSKAAAFILDSYLSYLQNYR